MVRIDPSGKKGFGSVWWKSQEDLLMGLSKCSKLSKILSHHDLYFLKFSTGTSIKLKAKEEDQHEDKFCLILFHVVSFEIAILYYT